MAVIMLPATADAASGPTYDYAAGLIPVIWTNLAGLVAVSGLLNWRNPCLGLAVIGTGAAVAVFAAAVGYTLLWSDSEAAVGGVVCDCGNRRAAAAVRGPVAASLRAALPIGIAKPGRAGGCYDTDGYEWGRDDIAATYLCLPNLSADLLTISVALGAFNPWCWLNCQGVLVSNCYHMT